MGKRIPIMELIPIIKEALEGGGSVKFTPTGTSMLPLFRDREDEVFLVKPDKYLKKYDIALYERSNGKYVLHRVIKSEGGIYTMRGDNQYLNESGIKHAQIIAVVSGFIRNDKEIKINSILYVAYSFIWVNTSFIRRIWAGLLRRIKG